MKSKSASTGRGRQAGSNGQKTNAGANGQKSGGARSNSGSGAKAQGSRSKQASGGNADQDKSALRKLLVDMMKDVYWAEKALTKALPKMGKNTTSPELMDALEEHLAVTEEQVSRLEQGFEMLGEKAQAKKCEAMAGLIKEGEEMMKETQKGMVRDAAIIAASQKIEHYEIASYGTICAFAKTIGESELASLMEETLNEEKEADQILTTVAESAVNVAAAGEEDQDADSDEEDDEDEEDDSTSATATKQATKSGAQSKGSRAKK